MLPLQHPSWNGDRWWTIDETTNISDLAEQIRMPLEELAIPELDAYVRDESLRDLWLTGQSPNLSPFQRLEYLSVLLKKLGPRELLKPTLDELLRISAGKPWAFFAETHIEHLMSEDSSRASPGGG